MSKEHNGVLWDYCTKRLNFVKGPGSPLTNFWGLVFRRMKFLSRGAGDLGRPARGPLPMNRPNIVGLPLMAKKRRGRKVVSSRTTSAHRKVLQENKELKEWRRRLWLLLEYGKKISVQKDLDSLLGLLVEEAKKVMQADRCSVFLLDKERNELWSRVADGGHKIRVPSPKGIVWEAVRNDCVINIPDAYKDARFNPAVDKSTGYKTRNILTAPMRNPRREIIGVFQVLNKKSGAFDKSDEKILLIFAEQAATAVENARLYEEVRGAAKDTILRLASAAEYKDKDTRNHLERMSQYAVILAEELGLPPQAVQNIALASPMHDIGKLGVSDAVLKKPGKLTEEEWTEMKKHPLYGSDILRNSDNELIRMSERVAKSHHEKWDGTGYPLGLKGEDIPIEGRIVALADVFDALTSRRVYKPAFSMEDTLQIIRDGSGKHFDPKCVEAFFRALPKIIKVMETFSDRPEDLPEGQPKDAPPAAAEARPNYPKS
jgi:HD-GYP domain-containing protein (c-di-GMP phosphodiesterase class II)